MIRKLYDKDTLKVKTIWHFINAYALPYSAKRKALRKWDEIVWLWYKKRGHEYFIKRTKNINYLLDINNLIDLRIAARGSYEHKQQDYFFQLMNDNNCSVFCDIGANWGMYSLFAATKESITEIHSFEPDEKNRSQLSANIFINKAHNKITIHSTALSSFDGEAKFASTESNAPAKDSNLENRGTSKLDENGDDVVTVKKLDSMLSHNDINIALKIDIEGNEIEAIRGMTTLLKSNHCVLQIETFPDKSDDLIAEMKTLSYQCKHKIDNDHYFIPE